MNAAWLKRDSRTADHRALAAATSSGVTLPLAVEPRRAAAFMPCVPAEIIAPQEKLSFNVTTRIDPVSAGAQRHAGNHLS